MKRLCRTCQHLKSVIGVEVGHFIISQVLMNKNGSIVFVRMDSGALYLSYLSQAINSSCAVCMLNEGVCMHPSYLVLPTTMSLSLTYRSRQVLCSSQTETYLRDKVLT